MFKKFRAIYGLKWDQQFDTRAAIEAAIVEWGEALYGLTPEQLKRGIDGVRAELEWPPSIAGFIKLAKGPLKSWEHAGTAYRYQARALPKPRANPEVVRGYFAAMRQALHAGGVS